MKPILPSLRRVETDGEIHANRIVITLIVTLAVVLELVDMSIVTVAIPHMMGSLGATLDEIAWVTTGYVVANVIVLPIAGWLSNFVGRRNYFSLSILVFTVASIFCGNATSLETLVLWRIVQGLAGGGLISTAQAVIYETFPPLEASKSMAIFGVGIMTGPMLGPTLGGWITDAWSWQWVFYINIPLGILAFIWTLMYVPESKFDKRVEEVDGLGFLLLAVGIGCLQTMLERGEKLSWFESREIVAYALVSVTALLLFIWQERRHSHPIVDLRILADRQFSCCLIFVFIQGGALFGTVFLLPVFMQMLLGFTAWQTGTLILPGALASGIGMIVTARVMALSKVDRRILVVCGALIFGYSMWLHSEFTTQTGWDDFLVPMVLRGFGLSMAFLPLNELAMGNLSGPKVASGSGLFSLMRQLGGSVGIAITATLFAQFQEEKRAALLMHVSQYSSAAQDRLMQLKGLMMSHGLSEQLAQAKALLLLNAQVGRQASVLSFAQMYLLFGLTLFCALPLLLLLRRGHGRGATDAAH